MGSNLFLVYNTGLTTYNGFTFVDEDGNTKTLDLNINESYYLNASGGVTSPSPDIVVYLMGTPNKLMSFESCCDDTKFSFYNIGRNPTDSSTISPFSGLTLNKAVYFNLVENTIEPIISKSSCFKLVSTGNTIPTGYPIFSTISFLDTQLTTFSGYPYKNLKGGEIESCGKCNQDYPCPPIPQNFYFKICCETGEPNTDYFGLQLLEGEVSEGFVFYIESDYFTGCATVINLNEFPEGSPLYISENYTLVEYPSCVVCTGSTVGCNTTPPPTPTIYYSSTTTCGDGILKRNECDPIVIFPMGVACVIVNPTNTRTTDGRLSLLITGGTPPYSVLWDNGISAPALSNLGVGTYTATVTDSYGDFTIIHSCSLTAPTPTPTPEPTPTPTCENLLVNGGFDNNLNGWSITDNYWVWSSLYGGSAEYTDQDDGTLLYQDILTVGCTYNVYIDVEITNEDASAKVLAGYTESENITTSGSYTFTLLATNNTTFAIRGFNNIVDGGVYIKNVLVCLNICNTPPDLCMVIYEIKINQVSYNSQIQFTFTGYNDLGYPEWGSVGGQTIGWNQTNNYWEMYESPTVYPVINNNPDSPPINGWTLVGASPGSYVTVTQGTCPTPTEPPLNLTTSRNNPTRGNNGSIVATATNGTPPYLYSKDNGVNYQPTGLFTGLGIGIYSIRVKDAVNNTVLRTVQLQ